jgi:hypothetical protein
MPDTRKQWLDTWKRVPVFWNVHGRIAWRIRCFATFVDARHALTLETAILRYVLIVVVRGVDVIVEDGRRIRRRGATGKEESDSWEAHGIVRGYLDMGFGELGIKEIDK